MKVISYTMRLPGTVQGEKTDLAFIMGGRLGPDQVFLCEGRDIMD
jgi:hypothetical protein